MHPHNPYVTNVIATTVVNDRIRAANHRRTVREIRAARRAETYVGTPAGRARPRFVPAWWVRSAPRVAG